MDIVAKIAANVNVNELTGCWEWQKSRDKKGYGQIWTGIRVSRAHRESYRAFIGDIPNGLCACHECDNPPCCNPLHLYLATRQKNTADAKAKGRQAKGSMKPQAKLNESQIATICERLAAGERQCDLAIEYGVCSLSLVASGKIWRHVDRPKIQTRKRTKITNEIKEAVVSKWQSGVTYDDISDQIGIARSTVSLLIHTHRFSP